MALLDQLAPFVGLLGLVGFAGLAGIRNPVESKRAGLAVRAMGVIGFAGLCGIWISGTGALGAAGALGLWNHQDPKLARWGRLAWVWVAGIPYLARHFME